MVVFGKKFCSSWTPERSEAVLWVWSVPNPRPEVPVDHVTVKARVPMALIAVTAER